MPFGLTNAPAAFQRFMNDIFSDLLDVSVIIYLDDILIYSNNPVDHKKHVCEVLCRLCENGLYAHPDKCRFSEDTIEYLGFILFKDGLKMDPSKVQTIQDWPEPRKVSFLGLANFYRRFISDYSDIVILLTQLTRKGILWNFTDATWKSFQALKSAFTSAPVLTHWVPDKPIIVETDASDYALGAILSIQTDSGEIHPMAFHSHTFSAPELNYDIHDKELLTISLRPSLSGNTSSKVLVLRLTWSWIIRTWNTFPQPRSLPAVKPAGPSISPSSTLLSASTLGSWAPNQIP